MLSFNTAINNYWCLATTYWPV